MILKSIELHNFRLYSRVFIDFTNDNNITIIKGNHGVGKTTLLNAISWCLYDFEIINGGTSLEVCNIKTVNSTEVGEIINVSVKLTFDDGGKTLVFYRVQEFYKAGKELLTLNNKLEVFHIDGNELILNNPIELIEEKIPMRLLDYFLIKGSYLDEFSMRNNFNPYMESFNNFSQLNIIQSSIHHLERLKRSFISKQKSTNPKLEKINEKINYIKNEINVVEEKKETAQLQKEDILKTINETKEKLDHNPNIQTKFDRKIELDRLIEKNKLELVDLKEKLKIHILTKYPYVLSYESFTKFVDAYQKSNEALDHIGPIIHIIKTINEFELISNDLHQKISKIEKDQNDFIEEKLQIDEVLSSIDDDEIKRLLHQYKDLNNLKHSIEKKTQIYSDNIKTLNKELKVQIKYFDEEKEKLFKELSIFQEKIHFCEASINVATEFLMELKRIRVERFEDCVNDMYVKFYRKNFRKVVINKEEIFIEDLNKNSIDLNDLSAAEKHILALCFILAIPQIYGLSIPIILDAPIYRLDNNSRKNFLQSLMQIAQEKQIVLLLGAEEYAGECENILNKDNVKIFEISENNQNSKVILDE